MVREPKGIHAMKKLTKRAYVLSQPSTMSAKDLVKKAAEENIKLSEGYVYNIRASATKKKKAPKPVAAPLAKAKPVAAAHFAVFSQAGSSRTQDAFVAALDALINERLRHALAGIASEVK